MSRRMPDMKMRPEAPIICTSLTTAPRAARSASFAATQANNARRHLDDQQARARHQDRSIPGAVEYDRMLIGQVVDDVAKKHARRELVGCPRTDTAKNGGARRAQLLPVARVQFEQAKLALV